MATGFKSLKDTARVMLGDAVADKLKDVWGYDDEGEVKAIWRPSGHDHFWHMGGNLAMTRYYSKRVALQILASEFGYTV